MQSEIKTGQIIETRSLCDYDVIYRVEILERKKSFATVKIAGEAKPVRCKVREYEGREYVMPFGQYSMAPSFYAEDAVNAPEPTEPTEADFAKPYDENLGEFAPVPEPVLIANDPKRAGQLAGKKEFFGTEGSSDFRFAIYPIHTRFGSVSWFVADAEKTDENGKATIIRQESSREKAIQSINGGKI